MQLSKRYNPATREPALVDWWQAAGTYHFHGAGTRRAIDTPPPTVSGHLHLGHVYSYSHADVIARFWRMRGYDVFYPMGYDDNGLPTERLVERLRGLRAEDVGREAFIAACLEVSSEVEADYAELWQRLGLSVDWRYTYRTIDRNARRLAQWSFLDLLRRDLAYRALAPAIWCPTCGTALAQADVEDLARDSQYLTVAFQLSDGGQLPIATTRPELLAACVAVFVHPHDPELARLVGQRATVPLYGQEVPILADEAADPEKGSGAVMCCTFGDSTDVSWWRRFELPLIPAIGPDGRLLPVSGPLHGLTVPEARRRSGELLADQGLVLAYTPTRQFVSIHDRCETPVEYMQTWQWFVRVLDYKPQLLALADEIRWHPAHMKVRYQQWVENLGWDWCISRQRAFGVPFPLWYCTDCGRVVTPDDAALPLDPLAMAAPQPCPHCGSSALTPETAVFDTWATSSLSPLIAADLLGEAPAAVAPFALRPQAHEIIRTWTFYTIVQFFHHFGRLPWNDVALSGWGLAPDGIDKISKSKGSDLTGPLAMINRYSADAVRYWSTGTSLGKDALISEERIQAGARFVNKLWNVARFSSRFLPQAPDQLPRALLTPADRWLLSCFHTLIDRATSLLSAYEYAAARSEIERFFWQDLADNYLEMAKHRLYEGLDRAGPAVLDHVLRRLLQLLAPYFPFVTEEIYRALFAGGSVDSLHRTTWPVADMTLHDPEAEEIGKLIVLLATHVRRQKSERMLSLGAPLAGLSLFCSSGHVGESLMASAADIEGITRAQELLWPRVPPQAGTPLAEGALLVVITFE